MRYEVSYKGLPAKGGKEKLRAGPLEYVRLKVYGHRQGTGFRRMKAVAGLRCMEVFGIFCKFLEISGNQPADKRGVLLNEHDKPASIKDLAFILDIPEEQVSHAVCVLSDDSVRWIEVEGAHRESIHTSKTLQKEKNTTQHNTTQGAGNFLNIPEISGKPKTKRFTPPTLDEVKAFIAANPELSNVDAETFWKGFHPDWVDTRGNPVRNWKLKLRTWSSMGRQQAGKKQESPEEFKKRVERIQPL